MKGRIKLLRRALATGLLVTVGAVLTATAAQAQASPLNLAYWGNAYGSTVTAGTVVSSGPTFQALLSACSAKAGSTSSNSGASTNVPNTLATGTVSNGVSSSATTASGTTRATSTVQNVGLLKGLVSATTVEAVSSVTYTASTGGFTFSNPSHVLSLKVAGKTVAAAPNTKVVIPGVGYAIINETHRIVTATYAQQWVIGIHLVVTVAGNVYGLAPGTNVSVGFANAGIHRPAAGGPVSAGAYGTHANVGKVVISGYSSLVSAYCLGGSRSTSLASVNMPHIGSTGTLQTSASTIVGATSSKGHATSTVQTVNLLGGLIKASAVKADVYGSYDGVTHRYSDYSTATNLVVNGKAITASAGSAITVSGVGTLYVHRVIHSTPRSYSVRMLELVVTVPNSFNLAVGTDVQVGVAAVAFRD